MSTPYVTHILVGARDAEWSDGCSWLSDDQQYRAVFIRAGLHPEIDNEIEIENEMKNLRWPPE